MDAIGPASHLPRVHCSTEPSRHQATSGQGAWSGVHRAGIRLFELGLVALVAQPHCPSHRPESGLLLFIARTRAPPRLLQCATLSCSAVPAYLRPRPSGVWHRAGEAGASPRRPPGAQDWRRSPGLLLPGSLSQFHIAQLLIALLVKISQFFMQLIWSWQNFYGI
jgi:hypothetical protein